MAILTLAEIIEAEDVTEKKVPVPEWGGEVIVKSISHRTMRAIKKTIATSEGTDEDDISEDDLEKWIFIKGMVSPEVDESAYESLLDKSTGAMMKVLASIMGSSKSDEGAIKEAEKSISPGSERVLPLPISGESRDDSGETPDGEVDPT